jgi:hypothetical protein
MELNTLRELNVLSDPTQKWNFDLVIPGPEGEKISWEAAKIEFSDGKMRITQFVTEKDGCPDLEDKLVKLRIYNNVPAVLFDMDYKLGKLLDASISVDATAGAEPLEVALVYEATFGGIDRNKPE